MRNKGFTLIEIVICIAIITVMMSIVSISIVTKDNEADKFIIDYLNIKLHSMINQESITFDNKYSTYPIWFNESGHVNQAQSVYIKDKKIIIELGYGILVEK